MIKRYRESRWLFSFYLLLPQFSFVGIFAEKYLHCYNIVITYYLKVCRLSDSILFKEVLQIMVLQTKQTVSANATISITIKGMG
jgi:hypothetical protein